SGKVTACFPVLQQYRHLWPCCLPNHPSFSNVRQNLRMKMPAILTSFSTAGKNASGLLKNPRIPGAVDSCTPIDCTETSYFAIVIYSEAQSFRCRKRRSFYGEVPQMSVGPESSR